MSTARRRGLFDWFFGEDQVPGEAIGVDSGPPIVDARLSDEGEIARGGFAEVRRVHDTRLLRRVALKRLADELASDPIETQRFLEEAQITGQLEHPNIPALHDYAVDNEGRHYFTMKLVEGKTLLDLVKHRSFDAGDEGQLVRLLQIFSKVCDAVSYAHSKGVVHCDLKPTNIMVGTHGQVYVMDWGIARLLVQGRPSTTGAPGEVQLRQRDSSIDSSKVLGTASYMPPEQARGDDADIDERSDVFALGAVLYRCLSGRTVYVGTDVDAVLAQAEEGVVERLDEIAPDVPSRLVHIAMKALAKDKADRYESVDALQEDIESFLLGEGRLPTAIYLAGSLIVEEGQEGDTAFVIVEGTCQVYRVVDGRKEVLREMGPGDVFGETAVLTNAPRTANVVATSHTEVTLVSRASLEQELGQLYWMRPFVAALATRFREVDERVTLLQAENLRVRVEAAICGFLARHGKDVDGRRVAAWSAAEAHLRGKLAFPALVVLETVESLPGIALDLDRDEVALVAGVAGA